MTSGLPTKMAPMTTLFDMAKIGFGSSSLAVLCHPSAPFRSLDDYRATYRA